MRGLDSAWGEISRKLERAGEVLLRICEIALGLRDGSETGEAVGESKAVRSRLLDEIERSQVQLPGAFELTAFACDKS